jgi:hypothetical protein
MNYSLPIGPVHNREITMSQFFYESSAKDKIKDLREEGTRSQAFYRSRTPRPGLLPSWPGLFIGILTLVGLFMLLVH